jgi:c-di-GMP-binding flagellar brake protein YcgR
MTDVERRQHPRYSANGLKAAVKLGERQEIVLYGEVVDISLDGIKIRLDKPTEDDLEGDIEIDLFLPNTEIPITVNGILKHINGTGQLGLHYLSYPVAETLNHFMFDCMKLSNSNR